MSGSCRIPCPTCPWRRDKHADTIPTYDHALAERLVATTSGELGAPIFACHQSRPEQEVVCVGWLWRYGWDSIAIRLRLLNGLLTAADLDVPPELEPELHETYEEVITKLREDVARMNTGGDACATPT